MSWNYRIMRKEEVTNGEKEISYGIVGAYYENSNSKPYSVTETFTAPYGDTISELTNSFAWMLKALSLPILDETLNECDAQVMSVDEISKWIDEFKDVKGNA